MDDKLAAVIMRILILITLLRPPSHCVFQDVKNLRQHNAGEGT